MASVITYCLCGQPYDTTRDMIQCDVCKDWFHNSCVNLQEYLVPDVDKYHCPRCAPVVGPSVFKEQTNWHRHNACEEEADLKSVQTGTVVFIQELKTRHFPSCEGVVLTLKGEELSMPFLLQHGFDRPIIVKDKKGLGMKIPEISVAEITKHIDPERKVDVIDVTRQTNITMQLQDFVEYFSSPFSSKPLNLISLEISDTSLAYHVEAPRIARELDWVNYVWPEVSECEKPAVQKYCLMGMKDSYTDFHIDFGGTSVWYHIYMGQKIFYLIKPTQANLSLYQRWTTSSTHSEMFFGDQVDMCYKCVMNEGETMLIPTGWIHAVLTPVPSLVYGGNFLHSLNIPMQLQVYEMERKAKTPNKFCYPYFETTNWYAACTLLSEIKQLNNQGRTLPYHLLHGVKALILTLKQWNQDRDLLHRTKREKIPDSVNGPKLLKDLSKEIRHAERYLNSLNPPKPERESKRKKRKPINKDFVDFSQSADESFEPKEPVRLTIKASPKPLYHNRKAVATQRPPLKLTLPKPATYPYSINKLDTLGSAEMEIYKTDISSTEGVVLSENIDKTNRKAWSLIGEQRQLKQTVEGELKLKLTRKNVIDQIYDLQNDSPDNGIVISMQRHRKGQSDLRTLKGSSIYDFHDGSDEEKSGPQSINNISYLASENEGESDSDSDRLVIRESPKASRRVMVVSNESPFRMRLSNMYKDERGILKEEMASSSAGDDSFDEVPKNGIEELLKASGYAADSQERNAGAEEIDSGRASPSTREAIAGMLSISGSFLSDAQNSKSELAARLQPKRVRSVEEDADNMEKVHQDEDYIYPAIDTSDEEEMIFKPRGKRKMDEAWCPKARVGPLVPKTDRPMREGTRKQSVEKVLEAAAAKKAGLPPPKRPYNKKKVKLNPLQPQHSTNSIQPVSAPLSVKKMELPKYRKPKKGMATVKQRLGKILKMHKLKF